MRDLGRGRILQRTAEDRGFTDGLAVARMGVRDRREQRVARERGNRQVIRAPLLNARTAACSPPCSASTMQWSDGRVRSHSSIEAIPWAVVPSLPKSICKINASGSRAASSRASAVVSPAGTTAAVAAGQ